ncbi:HsdR family type I site-specific deoxyribonuclease [Aminobacterium sp. MB27-C1]|uniref:type I restriction endonuclease subunit R n=1 Tax=Aminobacterium sp. MB27-C1 TaxID=3070661 RepID=UPI0027DAC2E7|nr:HsdR family type I site-specific deoxyribonuclease [Aminobacterium sp. MB27-C1]WMI72187.1 HsdR family type I site-specific deoxyribonuclease [Aminobacterium sp. MB27-C1]
MTGFHFNEKHLSQIPALQELINLGFIYLTPEQALRERLGKRSNVLLEGILREQLKKINRIYYKNEEYLFSEENIQSAIQKFKNIDYAGLLKTNENIYDLLTLGTSLEQTVNGDSKSFNLHYIDWCDWTNNSFHVTAEFSVEKTKSLETTRPDIVLFVNGIPFVVIECKSPNVDIAEAISQSIRNQREEYIPKLFVYTQMVMGINKNSSLYATVGSSAKFWNVWKELSDSEDSVSSCINKPISSQNKQLLFSGDFAHSKTYFDDLEKIERIVTVQDKAVFSLCRPERLLDLVYKFTVFDNGIRKLARYQQYFVIKFTLNRVKQYDEEGCRKGGIIWHTQGSGKSLTMVMLTRNLALDPDIPAPKIVLVTDRENLDIQLSNTFMTCGFYPKRAKSGRHLLELISERKSSIITTIINKFDKALNVKQFHDDSPDIYVLVDESHRSNYNSMAARMRQMFPKACYLGFTGTPLMKKEKNSFSKFGGLIEPIYSIRQAVEDGVVVPLLYEGRHVEMEQNKNAIDLWFERHTQNLSKEQKADMKKKYAHAETLNKTDQVIYMRAFDISTHFKENWQGTGLKAQLVAPSKKSALKYHEYLKHIGEVSSEVLISAPDKREGFEDVFEDPTEEVVSFWHSRMERYGSEEEYNNQVINQFKNGEDLEILIVVHKLLTGFDAPRNTVLYLCRSLKEHTLLQAIARVNRLHDDKEFGFIVDYVSILEELDKALNMYDALEGFDEEDLVGTLTSVNEEIKKLPQVYSDLYNIFKTVKHKKDEEAYEQLLGDDALRESFYENLYEFSKILKIALSTEHFLNKTPESKINMYKNDLLRFQKLKASVKLRYAEAIDYRDYEPKIMKLLNTHIHADGVIQLNKPVNIFDDRTFTQVKEDHGIFQGKSIAARADIIAHTTKKVITEKMEEDPAFFKKFSQLIQQAIDDYRQKRLSDLQYLNTVSDLRHKIVTRHHDDMPSQIEGDDNAMAYYGVIQPFFNQKGLDERKIEDIAADMALEIKKIFYKYWKVQFWDDEVAQNKVINAIDDYLYDDIRDEKRIDFSSDEMDEIIEQLMQVAKFRMV